MTARRPTCFILAQPTMDRNGATPDLRPLAAFGQVVALVTPHESPVFRPLRTVAAIKRRLAAFDPERDYLVSAGGGMVAALLVGYVLRELGVTRINWLSYLRHRDTGEAPSYRPVWMDLEQPDLGLEGDDGSDALVEEIP